MTPVQNALLQANGVGDGLMQTLLLPAIAQGVESVHSQLQSAHDVGALRVVAKEFAKLPADQDMWTACLQHNSCLRHLVNTGLINLPHHEQLLCSTSKSSTMSCTTAVSL